MKWIPVALMSLIICSLIVLTLLWTSGSFNFSKNGKIESNEKITASNGTIESRVTYERYPE